MFTFFVLLIVLASILMSLSVLIQNSKGGGLASGFASSNQIMGVRKTTDFLEKATWTIAVLMVAFSIFSAHALSSEKASQQTVDNTYTDATANEVPAAAPTFPVEE